MPPQEQADLWMSLRDRMKVDWKEMTMQEKKAGAYNLSGASSCCEHSYDVKGVLVAVPEAARRLGAPNAKLSRTIAETPIRTPY
jgi:hypothetical protein